MSGCLTVEYQFSDPIIRDLVDNNFWYIHLSLEIVNNEPAIVKYSGIHFNTPHIFYICTYHFCTTFLHSTHLNYVNTVDENIDK